MRVGRFVTIHWSSLADCSKSCFKIPGTHSKYSRILGIREWEIRVRDWPMLLNWFGIPHRMCYCCWNDKFGRSVRSQTDIMDMWYKKETLLQFPHLKKVMSEAGSEENFELWPSVGHLEKLQKELWKRFQKFSSTDQITKFVSKLFNAADFSETATLIGNIF
jgi:hypothetical protein